MNIPNSLSLLRVFLVQPFLIAFIYRQYPLALGILLAAGVSDFLDGFLARHLNQKSVLGTFLDPLGDRLLTTVAFVALGIQGLVPAWLAVAVVAKDLYVAIGAAIMYFTEHLFVAEASLWGKLSTLLQIVTIGIVLAGTFAPIGRVVMMLLFVGTGVLTVVACVHYVWQGVHTFDGPAEPG